MLKRLLDMAEKKTLALKNIFEKNTQNEVNMYEIMESRKETF